MRARSGGGGGKPARRPWRPPSPATLETVTISGSNEAASHWSELWPCVVVALVAALLYANTYDADFAYDDR